MKSLRENKYFDLLILVIIAIVVFKLVDNYQYFFSIIRKLYSVISPFIIAIICAYVLSPLVNLFEKKFKFNKAISILFTYALLGIIIFVFFSFTIPSLIDNAINMTSEIPEHLEKMQSHFNKVYYKRNLDKIINHDEIYNKIYSILTETGNQAIVLLRNSLFSILSLTGNIARYIFGFLISIYVLFEKEKLLSQAEVLIYMIFKEKQGKNIISVIKTYNIMIGRYIGIKAIDSLIIGLLAFAFLYIINVPYAIWIACIVGVTNMIPYFGPLVGEVFGVVVALFVSPLKALIVFIILLLIQQFDAWYLDPKLIGKKVGVSPFGIIFAVIIGGGFFGPIGMLLASPTMATINIYYNRMISNYKNKNIKLFK